MTRDRLPPTYDLNELCRLTGITPRTVRYYIQQGLLAGPGARGPGARYDAGQLDRIRLIRRLQREHLPLAEIRRRLEALDDEAVRTALAAAPPAAGQGAGTKGTGAAQSALDYVRDVLSGGVAKFAAAPAPMRAAAPTPPDRAAPGAPGAAGAPPMPAAPTPLPEPPAVMPHAPMRRRVLELDAAPMSARQPEPPAPSRSQWDRIALAPDIELHVRRPLSREQNRLVERLVDAARRLFEENAP